MTRQQKSLIFLRLEILASDEESVLSDRLVVSAQTYIIAHSEKHEIFF